jgi:hypothetical protein
VSWHTEAKKPPRPPRFYTDHRDIAGIALHFKKASISLKKSSKTIEIFNKTPTFLNKSLHFSGNVFKTPQFFYKNRKIVEKASISI